MELGKEVKWKSPGLWSRPSHWLAVACGKVLVLSELSFSILNGVLPALPVPWILQLYRKN